ncbi:MAG: ROK family transcriptional regulator [Candidatus Nanopelagicales bacterium]
MSQSAPARPALLRSLNDRTVLEHLVVHGAASRADLAEHTGLSKPTIAEVLGRLERAELIVDAGETVGRRGPNGRLHAAALDRHRAAALSVEPGRVVCQVVDARGTVLGRAERTRKDLPRGAAAVTRALVEDAARDAGIDAAGVDEVVVSLPGSYDPATDRVRYADRIPDWTVPGLAAAIAAGLPDGTTVTIDNDVNLALVAEREHGTAGESGVASLLWLGAGIGLATDLGGTLYRGVSGGAGEVGYIPVPAPDGRRAATRTDFQDVAGGAAVLALARELGVPGRTPAAAVERAAETAAADETSSRLLDELAARIALGLAVIVAVLDPGVVVLGGAVGRAGGKALAARTAHAFRAVSPLRCRIVASAVEGDPSLAGARAVAGERARDRLLDESNLGAPAPAHDVRATARTRQTDVPHARTAEEGH